MPVNRQTRAINQHLAAVGGLERYIMHRRYRIVRVRHRAGKWQVYAEFPTEVSHEWNDWSDASIARLWQDVCATALPAS